VVDLVAGEIASRHRDEQDIGVIRMDAPRPPAPSATTPGAEGGGQAAPAPRAPPAPTAVGDEYLVREVDGPHEAATDVALAGARIDLGATDTLTAALVTPGTPGPGPEQLPGPVIDIGAGDVPGGTPAEDMIESPVDGGVTAGGTDVDIGVDLDDDKSNNGNAYGHDKDKANGEARGHDKGDDLTNLLDSARKPGKK
jgi:hypothetical protein